MIRGAVCPNAGTYGSVGTAGRQRPAVTRSEIFGKVRDYRIEVLDGEEWKPIYSDQGTVDSLFVHLAKPVTAQKWRLVINKTNGQLPSIVAMDVYE